MIPEPTPEKSETLSFQSVADRVPPQNLEAEEAILGGILVDAEAIGRITDILEGDAFYLAAHRNIYEAALTLHQSGKPADLMTVATWLGDRGILDKVGGQSRLVELYDRTPSAVNIDLYAQLVMDKYLRRRLIRVGNEISDLGHDTAQELPEVLDSAEQKVFNITQARPQDGLVSTAEVLTQTFADIESRAIGQTLPGLACGFYDLDAMTQGFQRGDLIIVAGRPSMGKCLAWHSQIVLADGSVKTIEELYADRTAKLLTLSDDLKLQLTEPSVYVNDGIKPTFRVTTLLGKQIETTLTHPFLTIEGWKPLSEIQAGDRIAVPRVLGTFGHEVVEDYSIKILGYLLGDGSLSGGQPGFTNVNPKIQADFIEAIESFGDLSVREENHHGDRAPTFYVTYNREAVIQEREAFASRLATQIKHAALSARKISEILQVSPSLVCQWQKGVCVPDAASIQTLVDALGITIADLLPAGLNSIVWDNPLTAWLRELGLWGKTSHEKTIPDFVFRLKRSQIALLLNRLLATDGWASVLASGQCQVGYATVNEAFARQIQHLFLRFGIIARLKTRHIKYKGDRRIAWQLDITDAKSIQCLIDEIGIYGKEEAVENIRIALKGKKYQTNRDLIPIEVWELLRSAKEDESWKSLATRAGIQGVSNIHVGKRAPTRERLSKLATALHPTAQSTSLQNLANSDVYWDEIKSIEYVGDQQVYDLTIPGTHNFIANDICVHNTSVVLNIARNVASYHKLPVAVFSLEMSRDQLVQRLLSSEVRIESSRLRAGRISAQEWEPLAHEISKLSQLPLYIDDTPNLTVTEMRSRCRRLQAESGGALGLVVVDYLQLMGGNSENRVQMLSQITRGLKALARELSVPVIALSQLSRGVEARTDKRPMMSDLRECVVGETLVLLADGRRVPIASLVGTTPEVLTMTKDERITTAKSDCVWSVGQKPVFQVQLASGRSITATAQHRIYSGNGWQQLDSLEVGDRVAIARSIPEPKEMAKWRDSDLELLGHLIGDGSYLKGQPLRYTTASEHNSQIVTQSAQLLGSTVKRYPGRGNWQQLLISGNGDRWHPKGVNLWLRNLEIFNQRSHEKHIPNEIFQLSNQQISILLSHLWATDGCYYTPKSSRTSSRITFATNSIRLSNDVLALLLRFGIVARIKIIEQKQYRSMYVVEISGKEMQMKFLRSVTAAECKKEAAQSVENYLQNLKENPNRDTLPKQIFAEVRMKMREQGITQRQMANLRGTSYGGSSHFKFAPSRSTLLNYAEILNSSNLADKATSDLFWDEIVSITPIGEAEVFDLTVPGTESWLADGIVSHNSGAIEQDADLIMMIYRDEYYNKDTVDRGIAELIINKHRNGPTGTVKLLFEPQYTQFRNLSPSNRDG
jgi:replicative DNA helicase